MVGEWTYTSYCSECCSVFSGDLRIDETHWQCPDCGQIYIMFSEEKEKKVKNESNRLD